MTMNIINYLHSNKTKQQIMELISENIINIWKIDSQENINYFAASIYNWFIKECINYNQYIEFTESQTDVLKTLYKTLIQSLKKVPPELMNIHIEKIVKKHRTKLLKIMLEIFSDQNEIAQRKLCSEYSCKLQKQILRLEINELLEPILDIGCGGKAFFVKECMNNKKEVIGMDQYIIQELNNIICKNWLEFDYEMEKCGSFISQMAFTNHYKYHIVHQTNYMSRYKEKYIEILNSLKIGGSFYYSPSIPEIEQKLDIRKYKMNSFDNIVNNINIGSVKIIKIK